MTKAAKILLISILILVFGFSNSPINAQNRPNWQEDLLNLDPGSDPLKGTSPEAVFFAQYYKVYREFLKSMVCQRIENHSGLSAEVDLILEMAKSQRNSIKNDYDIISYLAGALLFRAVSAGQYEEYLESAKDLFNAHKYYKDLVDLQPRHPTTKIYGGIMAVLYGELPDEYYNWLAIIGIRMDASDGFRQLKEVYYSKRASGGAEFIESALILIIAMKEFEDDQGAAWKFIQLENLDKHPNILIRYYSALAAYKAGHIQEGLKLLDQLVNSGEAEKLPYIYYQLGRFRLFSGDPSSVIALNKFNQLNCGSNYVKSSWQKLGWAYILADQPGKAKECFQVLGLQGASLVTADQQALREIENEPVPEKEVLGLRLLFDGGYYKQCLEESNLFEKAAYKGLSDRQIVEVLYRQAGSHHLLLNNAAALNYYRQIVEKYPHVPSYQVPKAALQAGIISGHMGRNEEARDFFSLCLKYNNYGFQVTIRREAHSARRNL